MAYCHKRDGTWRFVLENESILYEFGPRRVPRQFDHKPTHQRRMLEPGAAVPRKMAAFLPVQLPPVLPSAPVVADADAAVDGREGAGEEEKGEEEAEPVDGAGAGAGATVFVHNELDAAFVRRQKARVEEAVEKQAKREKQKIAANASNRRAAAFLKSSGAAAVSGNTEALGDAAAQAAAAAGPPDATASTSHLIVCALCRVRPRVPTSLPACIGYLTAQAGESCTRCNVTAEVYTLLHKYRSFKLSDDDGNWFTKVRLGSGWALRACMFNCRFIDVAKALRNIRDSVRYNGLKNDLGKKDFDAVIQKALEKVNAGGDGVGSIDPGTGKHELSGSVGEEAGGDASQAPASCRSLLNVLQAPPQLAAAPPAARRSSRDTVAARSSGAFLNIGTSFTVSGRKPAQHSAQPQQGKNKRKK